MYPKICRNLKSKLPYKMIVKILSRIKLSIVHNIKLRETFTIFTSKSYTPGTHSFLLNYGEVTFTHTNFYVTENRRTTGSLLLSYTGLVKPLNISSWII